jgi:hypothetical protein
MTPVACQQSGQLRPKLLERKENHGMLDHKPVLPERNARVSEV